MFFKIISKDIYNSILTSSISIEKDYMSLLNTKIKNSDNTKERFFLRKIIQNSITAEKNKWPLCQDTGFLTFYISVPEWFNELNQLKKVISEAVERLWKDLGFRNSIVDINGFNTNNNLPAKFFFEANGSEQLEISYLVKGGGSENVSILLTLLPDIEENEFIDKISSEIIKKAGSKACPPYFIGIGKGGSVESSSINARKAILGIDFNNMNSIEKKICSKINAENIGLFGTGYGDTVFFVKIIEDNSHIANNVVSIALNCHSLRRGNLIYDKYKLKDSGILF